MYGDIISLGDALLIFVIAMVIVFIGLGLLYGILLIFKKAFEKKTTETQVVAEDKGSEDELIAVFTAAIAAYESDVK